MSIEKCAAGGRTPAECYVKKHPLKKSIRRQKFYTPNIEGQGYLVLRNSRVLCFLLQVRCGWKHAPTGPGGPRFDEKPRTK